MHLFQSTSNHTFASFKTAWLVPVEALSGWFNIFTKIRLQREHKPFLIFPPLLSKERGIQGGEDIIA
jgi:hypothetical protein